MNEGSQTGSSTRREECNDMQSNELWGDEFELW